VTLELRDQVMPVLERRKNARILLLKCSNLLQLMSLIFVAPWRGIDAKVKQDARSACAAKASACILEFFNGS